MPGCDLLSELPLASLVRRLIVDGTSLHLAIVSEKLNLAEDRRVEERRTLTSEAKFFHCGRLIMCNERLHEPLRELITVVITTSPVTSHPSLELLEKTLASFAFVPDVHECRFVIVADGCRRRAAPASNACTSSSSPADFQQRTKYGNLSTAMRSGFVNDEYARRYDEMKSALRARCEAQSSQEWHPVRAPFAGVRLLFLTERVGYGFALKEALRIDCALVTTRYVMVVQHDRTWLRSCSIATVLAAMEGSRRWRHSSDGAEEVRESDEPIVNCVSFVTRSTLNYISRFHGRATTRSLDVDLSNHVRYLSQEIDFHEGAPAGPAFLVPLLQFYDSTHLALTGYYRDFIFDPKRRLVARGGFVEDKVSTAMLRVMRRDGFAAGHRIFGTWLYDDGQSWVGSLKNPDTARSYRAGRGAVPLVGHADGGSYLTSEQRAAAIARTKHVYKPAGGVES